MNVEYLQNLRKKMARFRAAYREQSLEELLAARRITRVTEIDDLEMMPRGGGRLIPDDRGFTVWLCGRDSPKEKRISKLHELGHTFEYDLQRTPPMPLFESGTLESLCRYPDEFYDQIEALCERFARALETKMSSFDASQQSVSSSRALPRMVS